MKTVQAFLAFFLFIIAFTISGSVMAQTDKASSPSQSSQKQKSEKTKKSKSKEKEKTTVKEGKSDSKAKSEGNKAAKEVEKGMGDKMLDLMNSATKEAGDNMKSIKEKD